MTPSSAPQPKALPSTEVVIKIDREGPSLSAPNAEIFAGSGRHIDSDRPRQVRWSINSDLLPDEMVLIFGKPLDWSGPSGPEPDCLPLIENPFCSTFTLTSGRASIHSGPPSLTVDEDVPAVGWMYGVLLVRGGDRPLLTEPMIKIVRG